MQPSAAVTGARYFITIAIFTLIPNMWKLVINRLSCNGQVRTNSTVIAGNNALIGDAAEIPIAGHGALIYLSALPCKRAARLKDTQLTQMRELLETALCKANESDGTYLSR